MVKNIMDQVAKFIDAHKRHDVLAQYGMVVDIAGNARDFPYNILHVDVEPTHKSIALQIKGKKLYGGGTGSIYTLELD